jgi:uncharacterized OB-fold protein
MPELWYLPAPAHGRLLVVPFPARGARGSQWAGVVYAYTINHYRWLPDMEPPYVVAEVELVEQEGLRLMTNIVGCPPDQVRTGMEVEVVFARHADVYIPLFRPVATP